jgi:iron(III) transport system ATP-binding protein
MVFQSYAVWPHMTVFENTAFPLRMSRTRRRNDAQIKTKVERTLETVGLASLASRSAAQLSGGQQQRLSLARALVAEPRLLLLDEPLSNLDALLREQMRTELRRLQKEVGVTAIYVTHDQSEALALSDRLAIMQDGRIVQIGTPKNVYYTPVNGFVATFIGRSNMLSGKVERAAAAHSPSRVLSDLGPLACTAVGDVTEGQQVGVMIRPEHVVLTADGEAAANSPPNEFQGTVANIVFLGEATDYTVRVGTTEIIARLTTANFSDGETVLVTLPPDRTLCVSEAAARPQIS